MHSPDPYRCNFDCSIVFAPICARNVTNHFETFRNGCAMNEAACLNTASGLFLSYLTEF